MNNGKHIKVKKHITINTITLVILTYAKLPDVEHDGSLLNNKMEPITIIIISATKLFAVTFHARFDITTLLLTTFVYLVIDVGKYIIKNNEESAWTNNTTVNTIENLNIFESQDLLLINN